MSADTFPERLQAARVRAGITQSQLARKIHYAHATSISQWENGHYEPSAATIEALAAALNVEPDWLMHGTGPMRTRAERVMG